MPVVSNSSPIIALAHIRRLDLLRALYHSVLIPPAVKTECIDQGKAVGAQDVHEIEKGVQEGWISVNPLDAQAKREVKQLMARAHIGRGEGEAITLARQRSVPAILDDAEARAVARTLGLDYFGTVMVPYQAFVRKLLRRQELVEILARLSEVLWVSPTVIAEILRRAEKEGP